MSSKLSSDSLDFEIVVVSERNHVELVCSEVSVLRDETFDIIDPSSNYTFVENETGIVISVEKDTFNIPGNIHFEELSVEGCSSEYLNELNKNLDDVDFSMDVNLGSSEGVSLIFDEDLISVVDYDALEEGISAWKDGLLDLPDLVKVATYQV